MAIGFEFAIGWQAYQDAPVVRGSTYPPGFGKGAKLLETPFFDVTVDGIELEFIVHAIPEDARGEAEVTRRLLFLNEWIRGLNAKKRAGVIPFSELKHLFPKGMDRPFVLYNCAEDIAAIPQVTVGIRLGRLRKLMRILGNEKSEAAQTLFADFKSTYSGMMNKSTPNHRLIRDSRWPDHAPSAKLRGLATYIALYLRRGVVPMDGQSVNAVKYLMVMMSRTNFSALFEQLPASEKTHYRAAPDDWVSFLCTDVMTVALGRAVDPTGRLIEYLVNDRGNLPVDRRVHIEIKRNEWLRGILNGRDLLSAAAHPLDTAEDRRAYEDSNPGIGHRLRGLAGLGDKMDPVTYKGRSENTAIIEFRARQAKLPYAQWQAYGLKMFRFFRQINDGGRHDRIDLEKIAG
jgi:hypothetical protein